MFILGELTLRVRESGIWLCNI